jgi:hypothetical protein
MPVFHVYLNGRKMSTAGVGDLGVLTALVSCVQRESQAPRARTPGKAVRELTLDVGGLITPTGEQVRWLDRKLKVGDEVRIRIVENVAADRPLSREKRDRSKELRAQKRYVRAMAKRFGWKIRTR